MRFSGGALAFLGASKDGTDRPRNSHRRSLMMSSSSSSSSSSSTTSPITSRTNRQQTTGAVTTSAITNLQSLRKIVECDPTATSSVVDFAEERRLRGRSDHDDTTTKTTTTKDDDFGILDSNNSFKFTSACGAGRKCQEVSTSTSKSGGICVDVEGWNHRNLQQQQQQQEGSVEDAFVLISSSSSGITTTANANANVTVTVTTGILNEMQYLCDYGHLVGYDCKCNFNKKDYTGSGTCIKNDGEICTASTSICDVSIEDCYSFTYGITLVPSSSSLSSSSSWDAEFCLQFSKPYEQTVCYTTSNSITSSDKYGCSISIDGETCTSCEIEEETCYVFDCTNTQAGMNGISKVGNTCDYPVYPISLYLDTYGCPPCNLCDISADGMTSPDSTITMVAGSDTAYVCSTVAEIAGLGFFTTDTCEYFANLATEPCGCISSSASSITDFTEAAVDAAESVSEAEAAAETEATAATTVPFVPEVTTEAPAAMVVKTDEPSVLDTGMNTVAATLDPTSAPVADPPTTAPFVPEVTTEAPAAMVVNTDEPSVLDTGMNTVAATLDPTSAPVADPTRAPVPATGTPTPPPTNAQTDRPSGSPVVVATSDSTSAPVADPPTTAPFVPEVTTEAPAAMVVKTDEPILLDTGMNTYNVTENDDISGRNYVTDEDIDRTSTTDNDEEDVNEQANDIDVYNINSYCSPCGQGKKVLSSNYDNNEVSIPTQGTFTCKELYEFARQYSFNPICALVQSAANVPCGCNDEEDESASTTAIKNTDTDTDASSSTTNVNSTASAATFGTAMNYYSTFFIVGVVTSTIMIASSSL